MIILTGVSGFIGSCFLRKLNQIGFNREVVVVDDFYKIYKDQNTLNKAVREWMHRDIFLDWFEKTSQKIDYVIHLGARTDTTLMDKEVFDELNFNYSKRIWNTCAERQIPLIYASSAATYGDGSLGFKDDHDGIKNLNPLNPYGQSKHDFDVWALSQKHAPPQWFGCKFFNVYGPNEYHKSRMASVIFHTFHKIKSTGEMQLFKSHKTEYKDGEQSRDFIYIKDLMSILTFLMQNSTLPNGIYNCGTGQARTFLDLALSTFAAMNVSENISFIDTPIDIRDTYQYYTEADMTKMKSIGYNQPFHTLEEGITDYVQSYLSPNIYY